MTVPDSLDSRIITTLGHVDHGKTTLMDALLAANNIVSLKTAGKMRYMDSREDEQEKGITMESSAISLKFSVRLQDTLKTFVINVIDTPGHVDFSSEVSTASRLCDGALVLVDVVEGVCTQTIAVLRQAWQDQLRPILVINKLDRLVTEMQLGPLEAYLHLSRLIEQVNAVLGSLFAGDRMEDDLRRREERERRKDLLEDETVQFIDQFEEKEDVNIYFSPNRGNVVFSSAIDGWGFRIGKFAQLYAVKLGIKEANLRRVLWGDYFFDPKSRKVINSKHLRGRVLKPLFVQFILENIWAVYDAVILNPNPEKVSKITTTLGLNIPNRDLKSKDNRHLLSLILPRWLPLSTCIVQAVIDVVPAPSIAQGTRIPKLLYPGNNGNPIDPMNKVEEDIYSCNPGPDGCIVAFVSKMFAVSEKQLSKKKKRATARHDGAGARTLDCGSGEEKDSLEDAEVMLGFARLYCGTIRTGVQVHCVLPKYKAPLGPDHPHNLKHLDTATVQELYMMMGRELVSVECVHAGSLFAIGGLEGKVWRNATLCAPGENDVDKGMKDFLINLGGTYRSARPIVRAALEPVMSADMPKLISGLKLLVQSDPCVETFQQQTGEHVIVTAGELHLERCLRDLRERFAKVEIQASKPIVPFRETAVDYADLPPPKTPNAARGTILGTSSRDLVKFTIRASPIPKIILNFILENIAILKELQECNIRGSHSREDPADLEHNEDAEVQGDIVRQPTVKPERFWTTLHDICNVAGGEWINATDRILAFGPQKAGGCILVDSRTSSGSRSLKHRLGGSKTDEVCTGATSNYTHGFDNYLETGFQLATLQGPLCGEPVEGLAYFVEGLEVNKESLDNEISQNRMALVTSSIISAVRDACRNGLLDWSPRLMLAMYTCHIQASTDVLGKVYGVITKRRGRIIAEEIREGTDFFYISASLPVVESFGFADDIRTKTSGAASPQLVFSGYELLDEDPFWVPTTGEELEELGGKADRSNVAKGYMDMVRDRKGMLVDKKLVENAEKQRTLKK